MVTTLINEYTEGDEPYVDRQTAQYKSALPSDSDTYVTLGKDIQLVRTEDMKYDRLIQSGDFVVVTGIESLAAAIRIKLQTWKGELNEMPLFKDFGNSAWFFLKANKNEITKEELKGYSQIAIEEMRRINSVNAIDISDYPGQITDDDITVISAIVTPVNDNQPIKIQQEVLTYGI